MSMAPPSRPSSRIRSRATKSSCSSTSPRRIIVASRAIASAIPCSRSRKSLGPEPDVVTVHITVGADGIIRSASAVGHAGSASAGSNIACAAVTVLLRTAYETMAQYEGLEISGEAPAPGSLNFTVRRHGAGFVERLRGAGDFLLTGLSAVEREYPGLVRLIVDSERRQ
ncbi:MAG: ribosomal-processing cysteine protease Prp [Spirochaetales bacterium]|nr:MAG: ribosomal-processing cysteine protease Prp [Spirochaetales bacterium]